MLFSTRDTDLLGVVTTSKTEDFTATDRDLGYHKFGVNFRLCLNISNLEA